jgi:uncharacterized protein
VRGLSEKVVIACAMFGLEPHEARRRALPTDARGAARELDRLLLPGEVALVTGPSGGGKSTILRELRRVCGGVVVVDVARDVARAAGSAAARGGSARAKTTGSRPERPQPVPRCVVDLFRGGVDSALGYLARAGLADATILALSVRELSEGQRSRVSLALGMERVRRVGRTTLIIDEFASCLDRETARSLARLVSRWASREGVRVVCATAHEDLLEALRPAVLVVQPLMRPAMVARSPFSREAA